MCKRVNKLDKNDYLNALDGIVRDQKQEDIYFDLVNEYGLENIQEARKINKATYSRVKRLRNRISIMLENHCIWCTFTWKDSVFNTTNEDTRRQYVRRYLNAFNCPYIANIDYGSDNEYIDSHKKIRKGTEREHYHAVIMIDKLPLKWSYGHQWLEHIRLDNNTDRKISKYLSKLTNHAIKESCRGRSLIYSRLKA